ncbi:hypothetical protein GGF46_002844 [Coemansia sp. RSA 552]|nr:hypothetical protein GGF46_002844 [Coemansia sp. RSA 552]
MTNNEEYTRAQAQKAHDLLKSIRRRHVQLEQYLKSFNMYRANPLGGAMCAEVEDKIHQMALLIRTQQNQVRHIVDEYDQCLASPSSFASSRSDSLDGLLAWDEPQVRKLRQLWQLLINEFDRADAEPLPVLFGSSNSSDVEGGDVTSLSFEPLVPLSKRDRERIEQQEASGPPASAPSSTSASASTPASASPATPKEDKGWFGWASGRSTPAGDEAAEKASKEELQRQHEEEQRQHEEEQRLREETVQGYLVRSAQDAAQLVPEGFKPILSQPTESRTFRAAFWQAATQLGDADSWVLRFLRARSWDVDEAFQMVSKALEWRVGQSIDEVVYFGESHLHYHTMETGLAFACGRDRLDNPVYVVRVRVNISRNRNIQAIKRFLCWQIETSQLLSTGAADGRVTIIFDMTGFTRENIDLKLVRTLISLLTNYYPETLGILILYVNSWLFSSIWTLISPFIDPAVKSKIVMAKSPAELEPFIDPNSLISEVGGNKKYQYHLPTPEENSKMHDTEDRQAADHAFAAAVDGYEAATRKWLLIQNKEVGLDVGGRGTARESLRKATVALDPYIRARTLYHRLGYIKPDHTVSFA